jgi:outer membrane protein OmpA-like peptidoglycan-associated protein
MTAHRRLAILLLSVCVAPIVTAAQETTRRPALTAAMVANTLEDRGSIMMPGIVFDSGKASFTRESFPNLDIVGDVLKNNPALALEIQAYTDNIGSRPANVELSKSRANAVRNYLIKTHGIAPDRLVATGLADANPIGDNSTARGRSQNRRIELVRMDMKKPPPTPSAQSTIAAEWTGRVTTGMMAIGGESTGIMLANGRESFELQPANDAIRQQLQNLNGKSATVRGRLDIRQGVEVRERRIITVTEVIAR